MKSKFFAVIGLGMSAPIAAQVMLGSPEVIDGDTFRFGGDKIRIQGIDAPEAQQLCGRGNDEWQCGQAATDALQKILARGRVTCRTVSRDVYGRALADCSAGGLSIGRQLLAEGMAITLDNASADFRSAEAHAQKARIGIWRGEFQRPAEFRAANPNLFGPPPKLEEPIDYAASPAGRRIYPPIGQGIYFRNCAQARAAGYSSMRRGEPGYRSGLDGDNDGIACEPYRGR